jgi:hypothetical protein
MRKFLKVALPFWVLVIFMCSCSNLHGTPFAIDKEKLNDLYSQAEMDAGLQLDVPVKYVPKIFAGADGLNIRVSEDIDMKMKTIYYGNEDSSFSVNGYYLAGCEVSYFDYDLPLDNEGEDELFKEFAINGNRIFIYAEYQEGSDITTLNFIYYPEKNVSCYIAATRHGKLEIAENVVREVFDDFSCETF